MAIRLLSERLSTHHPEAEVTWLVCDPRPTGLPPVAGGQATRFAIDEEVAGHRYVDIVMATSTAFARWAVIPVVADRLMTEQPGQTIVVLSPSVDLAGPLDDLITRSGGGALFLPRRFDAASQASSEGWISDFAVLGPLARPLIAWWKDQPDALVRADGDLGDRGRVDPWATFLDTAPGVVVAGDGRYRVSPWTVGELRLDLNPDQSQVLVDGRPPVLSHFPGFDPSEPWWYAPPGEPPVVFASQNRPVQVMCEHRAGALLAEAEPSDGRRTTSLPGWNPGMAATAAFRTALVEGDRPPNPYVAGEVADFVAWLTTTPTDSETGISIAADDVWDRRADLAGAIPSVKWAGRPRFTRWMWSHGLVEGDATLALLPDPPRPGATPGPSSQLSSGPVGFGVNLVGYHGSDAGLGVAVRRVARALDAAGIPWHEVRYDRTASRQRGAPGRPAEAPYFFHLVLIAPDQLPLLVEDLPDDFFDGHYTIGLWYWETDVLTPGQVAAIDRRYTTKPVQKIPIPLVFPAAPARPEARRSLGFDDRFTFLFSFDYLSIPDRKNPSGVIEAFQRAFGAGDDVRLIIKSINGDGFVRQRERLAHSFAGDGRIEMWDRYLSGPDRLALVAAADCYVSLHRSEGLGLTMAEAMAANTPVIATRYSGNLDFMDDRSALLVDAEVVEIGPGHHYPPTGHWADPDLDQAAAHMRSLWSDPALRARLAAAARSRIGGFGAPAIGHIISDRLAEVWRVASVADSLPVTTPL
jgi:glycosyltransferase involved in cell wall biosynthesis